MLLFFLFAAASADPSRSPTAADSDSVPGVSAPAPSGPLDTAAPRRATDAAPNPVAVVPELDIRRYAGRWFEIARYPNRFQKQCAGDVTAEYEVSDDGRIRVTNRCRRSDGSTDEAVGVAKLASANGPASQLKVRFAPAFLSFIPQVWGDYWVIGLARDYRYAVVGDPGRNYLWILSRTPVMNEADYGAAIEAATKNGFDVDRLVRTKQTGS